MNEGVDMGATAAETGQEFWRDLLEHIIEKGRRTPKVQVERAIGPILGFFLERHPTLLGGNMTVLAAEFPLKKDGNMQSTNVDWLLFDRSKDEPQLVLLELKTDSRSFKSDQLLTYFGIGEQQNYWEGLRGHLKTLKDAGGPYAHKYASAWEQVDDALPSCDGIAGASIRVIYLAPETMRGAFERACADRLGLEVKGKAEFISFGDMANNLSACVGGLYPDHLGMLCDALKVLDAPGVNDAPGSWERNYQECNVSLDCIIDLCRGFEPIVIGYMKGEKALLGANRKDLESRVYRWDWANPEIQAPGNKKSLNWIDGETFLKVVEAKMQTEKSHLAPGSQRSGRSIGEALEKALEGNPGLTVGLIIELVAIDAGASLSEMTDDNLLNALKTLPAQK